MERKSAIPKPDRSNRSFAQEKGWLAPPQRRRVHASFPVLGAAFLAALSSAPLAYAADVTCYVDSVAGDDTKSGLTEAEAVQSRSKIPTTCTIVKFKRGSVFNLASGEYVVPSTSSYTSKVKTITNYGDANLPLPKFIKVRAANNGGMISAYSGGMTIDGLYLEGSESDAQMKNLAQGICIMAGSNSKIINNEITNCDIGMMLSGTGTLVQNNYVHDLHVTVDAAPGVDPNVVGGAEGIFVNGSNNEVAYNTFINCSDTAQWTGGDCDGGATEVTVGGDGAELTGVKIHHNYSYNSCGFFEVSSGFSSDSSNPKRGIFSNSEFYNNVTIDSGWLSLLQVANTDIHNFKWENNTLVQHKGSTNAGILVIVYTAVASGMSGGEIYPDGVTWTNNLFVADGVTFQTPDSRIVQTTNLIINTSKQDPGFVNLKGTNAADYDLVSTSPAINAGTVIPSLTLDFLNRTVPDPTSGKTDIGAFEYASTQGTTPPPASGGTIGSTGGAAGTGGARGTGGASGVGGTGGASGVGGTTTTAAGKGGAGGSSTTPAGEGGAGGSSTTATGKGGAGGSAPTGTGGGAGGTTTVQPGTGGATTGSGGQTGSGGAVGTGGSASGGASSGAGAKGCACTIGGRSSSGSEILLLGTALALALLRRRRTSQ
jgi:MYXO-CTERM domain-containing protein